MLQETGLGFWARRYQQWQRGEGNQALTERALFLPKKFQDHETADIPALMRYLEKGEEEEVYAQEKKKIILTPTIPRKHM